ncbi:MAG: type II toxin-antitoxin system RelE/ParE family toxin [Armatimonadetes bacterium]|nr:type II toxin-antitoxin system RelE/ParE family toxin [Armatimonadota bacterium]
MVRQILDEEQKKILEDPRQGERKRGALQDVWVWKFRAQNDQYLLAYLISEKDTSVIFLDIGQHENFYRDLERHLKTRVEDAS